MNDGWLEIKGYEGYFINKEGKILSKKKCRGKTNIILKHRVNKTGYIVLSLMKDKKIHTLKLHRLIAETFIPNPNNYPIINHINGNKLDNRIENLEWCTYSYNNYHAYKNRLKIAKKGKESCIYGRHDLNCKKIKQFDKNMNFIKEWKSQLEIENEIKINNGNISQCCYGKRKTAGGYIWKFSEE